MRGYGCLASLILAIALVLVGVGVLPDQPKQPRVQAQTGVIDLLPYKAYIPYASKYSGYVTPTPTPIPAPTETPIPFSDPSWIQRTPGAVWYITQLNMVPCERASGNAIIFITVLDRFGLPVDGVHVTVKGQSSGIELYGISGEKAPGKTEIPVSRDGWDVFVTDGLSDYGMNMRQDLPNDPGCPGRFGSHFPYEVVFRKVR